jgi:hypothetical protein
VRFLVALIALLPLVRPQGSSRDDPRAMRPPRAATLHELRTHPGQALDQELRFPVQFKGRVEDWNPFVSRFGPMDWLGFQAWPDERFTWEPAVWDDPAPRLFVRRGSPAEARVRAAREHARYAVTGRVREVLLGEPWIEVEGFERLEGEVGPGTIVHVQRARDLVQEGQFELAIDQYERAKAAPLPPHARAAIEAEVLEARDLEERLRAERPARRR